MSPRNLPLLAEQACNVKYLAKTGSVKLPQSPTWTRISLLFPKFGLKNQPFFELPLFNVSYTKFINLTQTQKSLAKRPRTFLHVQLT